MGTLIKDIATKEWEGLTRAGDLWLSPLVELKEIQINKSVAGAMGSSYDGSISGDHVDMSVGVFCAHQCQVQTHTLQPFVEH